MEINKRIKPRQSGKSQDCIEMVEALLSIGRKVVLILPSSRMVNQLKFTNKALIHNKDYKGRFLYGSSTNLDFMRGHRVDCVVVDEFKNTLNQQDIILMVYINSAVLYTTES